MRRTGWLAGHYVVMGSILAAAVLTGSACDSASNMLYPTEEGNGNPANSSPGLNADGTCSGAVGEAEIENLVVEDDESCSLQGTRITGNLFVQTRAELTARDVWVGGNIQSEGATLVDIGGATVVDGNVQIKQGRSVSLHGLTIGADLQLEQNTNDVLGDRNRVEGNLQVFGNTGGVTLTSNNVAENLQCKENVPTPVGGGNVAGNKEDQCEDL